MKYDIEAYLNNEMEANERQNFEAELRANTQLQEEVEAMRILIRDLRRLSVAKQVGAAQKQLLMRQKTVKIVSTGLLLVAFFSLIVWFFVKSPEKKSNLQQKGSKPNLTPQNTPPKLEEKQKKDTLQSSTPPIASVEKPANEQDFEDMALHAYQIPAEFQETRSNGIPKNSLDTLKVLFIDGKYDEGLSLLNKIVTLDADQKFLYAHFLFKKGAFAKAQQLFHAMEVDPEMAIYKEDVQWFELLAALAQGKKEKKEVQRLYQLILNDTMHNSREAALNLNKNIEFQKLVQ